VWVLSGRSGEGLLAQGRRLQEWLLTRPELDPVDVGWSLISTRARLEHRAVLVGTDRDELMTRLQGLIDSEPGMLTGTDVSRGRGRTAFVFPGQGAQLLGMGSGLYKAFPVFAAAFDETAALLEQQLECSLRDVVWGVDEQALQATLFTQTGLFAVGIALFRLLESFGVRPDFVAGHSIGELAAATVAGVLSLEDAAVLVAARARLMQQLPTDGAMLAVRASETQITPLLGDGVEIAAVNGPQSIALAGPRNAIDTAEQQLRQAGYRVNRLRVSHAFHSASMEPMLAEFARIAAGLTYTRPTIPIVSNHDGQLTGPLDDHPSVLASPQYWVDHVRNTVRFADGITTLATAGATRYVVMGPDGGLSGLIDETLQHSTTDTVDTKTTADGVETVVASLLHKDRVEDTTLLSALAVVDVSGVGVDWTPVFDGRSASRV
ncbi:acyltransferase domain-containing protein, partial [Nocardia noduli]|uniref:acyltransferase domain-containing protein n=1 Tax=Nocardia noduli TaxID=2815722 RepID=UPI001C2334C3